MPKNRISRRVADSDYEYFSPLGAALSRVAVSRDFFRRRIAVIRRPRHATIKRPRSGPRAHTTPSPTTARRTIRRTRVPPCPPSPPPRRTPRPAPPERSGGAPRARAASSPRRDRRKNPFPGSFFDRREGAPASPLGPALSPGPIRPRARRRRPGASRRVQRARRARPRRPRPLPRRAAPRATPRGRVVGVVVPRIPRGASRTLVARRSRRGGAPGAALPAPPPPWVPERTRSRRAIPDRPPDARLLSSRTRRTTTRRRGGAKRPDPPTFARTRQCTRLVLLGSNDVFHVLFFSFRSKFNAVQSPSSPPPVGPRRESSALRSPSASPR